MGAARRRTTEAKNSIDDGSPPCSPHTPTCTHPRGARAPVSPARPTSRKIGCLHEGIWRAGTFSLGLAALPAAVAIFTSLPTPSRSKTCSASIRAVLTGN